MPRARTPLAERFWNLVDRREPDECWPWTGATSNDYGVFQMGRGIGTRRAHVVANELTNGPLPQGMWVLHHCDNPPCCNPAHHFRGSAADNNRDMHAKGRSWQRQRTACPMGHEYDEGNTYIDSTGRRRCRTCRRERRRAKRVLTGRWQ